MRLCTRGYQFCVLDGRGAYLEFEPAVVFGTHEHAPDPTEVLTALEKPEIQAVVCLAAVPPAQRADYFERFLSVMHAVRDKTGRPHWLVLDEAEELVPAVHEDPLENPPAENTIYVTSNPEALAPDILAAIDVVAAVGENARQSLEAFATARPASKPAEALRAPGREEALVWFHRTTAAPSLVTLVRPAIPKRPIHADVGRFLRRA